jgi:hypothetical protein
MNQRIIHLLAYAYKVFSPHVKIQTRCAGLGLQLDSIQDKEGNTFVSSSSSSLNSSQSVVQH